MRVRVCVDVGTYKHECMERCGYIQTRQGKIMRMQVLRASAPPVSTLSSSVCSLRPPRGPSLCPSCPSCPSWPPCPRDIPSPLRALIGKNPPPIGPPLSPRPPAQGHPRALSISPTPCRIHTPGWVALAPPCVWLPRCPVGRAVGAKEGAAVGTGGGLTTPPCMRT